MRFIRGPPEFIPAVDESGLLLDLRRRVPAQAVSRAAILKEAATDEGERSSYG
jgi:EAL domain-containing protein (putative c-di-GMP-specific phosphodiesterase class I)